MFHATNAVIKKLMGRRPCSMEEAATDELVGKVIKCGSWSVRLGVLGPPLLWLASRRLLWLGLRLVDIEGRWRSAWVVSSRLVCNPTVRRPGFGLSRQQWSLLGLSCAGRGHCGACRRKWRLTDTDLRPCGETQTMSHIVESCPLTKLNGGLSRLHSWLTNYG